MISNSNRHRGHGKRSVNKLTRKTVLAKLGTKQLEKREMFAVMATFDSDIGLLRITGEREIANQIEIRQTSGKVSVDGVRIHVQGSSAGGRWGYTSDSVVSSSISKIEVYGGKKDDLIRFQDVITETTRNTFNRAIDMVVLADSGDDLIYGSCGADIILGESGKDRIYGGEGDDKLIGGSEDDQLFGVGGNDYLDGSAGNDYLAGENGEDRLIGGSGRDYLRGGADDDRLLYSTDCTWNSMNSPGGASILHEEQERRYIRWWLRNGSHRAHQRQ